MVSELKRDIVPSLQLLPYAREVQAWLIDFVAAATPKEKPPEDYILNLDRKSATFVDAYDIKQAVDFISIIYKEQGYMEPWDLEDRLILTFNPRLPRGAIKIAEDFSAFEKQRDRLTNYYQKPQTPLVMGLAALYQQTQNMPVSIFEVDFSNMRGTNEHNEKIIQAAYPDLPVPDVRDAAMDLTDQYAFLVANVILKSVEDRINSERHPPVRLIPLRTGGDEVRIVAVNMTDEEARAILPSIHKEIESVTAVLDLQAHPHAKRPLDNFSNGFGAAATTFALKADGLFNDAIQNADEEIGINKVRLGRARALYKDDTHLDLDNHDIYHESKIASQHLDLMSDTINLLRSHLGAGPMPVASIEIAEMITQRRKLEHFPDKDEMQAMIFETFIENVERHHIQLTPDQKEVLAIKVLKFPQNDPSSGALSGRDFPAMAGVALQVVQNVNESTGMDAHLWTMGVSFHNLSGLNETLGHGYSNLVLHEQTDIIRQSLHRVGLDNSRFQIAHMGNGDYSIVIQPLFVAGNGALRAVDQHDIDRVARNIEERVGILNRTSISFFLQKHGISANDKELPAYFADIQNPRDERLPGIRASISAKPYTIDPYLNTHINRLGGAVRQFISEHLTEMSGYNKERWAREPFQKPDFSPPMPF